MGTISISSMLIAFLSALGIGLVVRSGHTAATEPRDTHAADLAGIEKLRRADIDATLTQDPAALNTLWSDEGERVLRKVPSGAPGIQGSEIFARFQRSSNSGWVGD
jgi:hypothetical protein